MRDLAEEAEKGGFWPVGGWVGGWGVNTGAH